MEIYLDALDEECTPTVKFCCRNMFDFRNFLIIDTVDGLVRLDVEGSKDPKIQCCPFCGKQIQILRSDA